MRKDAKKYMNSVIDVIIKKYCLSEIEAYKAVKESFLYDSLIKFPDETLHDDIETNADFVYQDYTSEHLLQM
ncbi:MAG: hypothetical protein HDR03_14055 [Lachnospiraceae bacterium]|nr:hypothetical protein [Lachnospiraceae bacterium]